MLKASYIFYFLLSSQLLFSQEKLSVYKSTCDQIIDENFDKSLINKVKLVDIFVQMNDSNKSIIVNYETDKNKLIDLSAVTFLFQFYSVAIDQLFKFNIKLSRGREIIQTNPSIDEIPKCLVKNTNCSFITKDSAIKIAIADSILFRDNLKIDLLKEFKKDVFYWRVIGSPKKGTSNPKNTPIQRRIIHSITGKIVRKD